MERRPLRLPVRPRRERLPDVQRAAVPEQRRPRRLRVHPPRGPSAQHPAVPPAAHRHGPLRRRATAHRDRRADAHAALRPRGQRLRDRLRRAVPQHGAAVRGSGGDHPHRRSAAQRARHLRARRRVRGLGRGDRAPLRADAEHLVVLPQPLVGQPGGPRRTSLRRAAPVAACARRPPVGAVPRRQPRRLLLLRSERARRVGQGRHPVPRRHRFRSPASSTSSRSTTAGGA